MLYSRFLGSACASGLHPPTQPSSCHQVVHLGSLERLLCTGQVVQIGPSYLWPSTVSLVLLELLTAHCSPEGHLHHHQRSQLGLGTLVLVVHLQDECTSVVEGLTQWHLATQVPHSRWRRPGPRSHWQTSRVMYCTRLVRPRVTTTTHHGQSDGILCSMLCLLVVHLSCSKPNYQLHTPCAGALHCVSAHVQPCCSCLNGHSWICFRFNHTQVSAL